MPVRIYDISKKLGLENKAVLSKAKALGLAAAKVASSSLDKITAEYLEQQILLDHPNLVPTPVAPPAAAAVSDGPTVVLAPPPPQETEPLQKQETATAPATALREPRPPPVETAPALKAAPPLVPDASVFGPPPPKLQPEPIAKAAPPTPAPPP